jgi:hypothetical protein
LCRKPFPEIWFFYSLELQPKILAILEVRRLTSNHSNRLAVRLPRSQSPPHTLPNLAKSGRIGTVWRLPGCPPELRRRMANLQLRLLMPSNRSVPCRDRLDRTSAADGGTPSLARTRWQRPWRMIAASVASHVGNHPFSARQQPGTEGGMSEIRACFVGAFHSVAPRHGAKPQPIDLRKDVPHPMSRLRPFLTSAKARS